MKRLLLMAAVVALCACTEKEASNPFLSQSDAPFGAVDFSKIESRHYLPAFKAGMEEQKKEIDAIAENTATPTFENTIEALEATGFTLARVSGVFFNLNETDADDLMRSVEQEITPLLTEHSSYLYMNSRLFDKIRYLYDSRESLSLTREQIMTLEKYYNNFVSGGALLSTEKKARLVEINTRLSLLQIDFANRMLAETNAYSLLVTDPSELKGLPDDQLQAAAARAKESGKEGYLFNIQKPTLLPFLQYCENRELRRQMYTAYYLRGNNNNEFDNKSIVGEILNLRLEKSRLLGYNTFAEFKLHDKMAGTPQAACNLLMTIWDAALPKAKEERALMQEIINSEGGDFKLEAWDWWFYAEKLRKLKYDFDESEVMPYLTLENARKGAFMVAEKLFGITFEKVSDMTVYYPGVEVYECLDSDGSHLAYFYADNHVRSTKRQGAWMSNFSEAYNLFGNRQYPSVVNVLNNAQPNSDGVTFLSIDDVRTLFHEFGHALHGMLTKASYPAVSGTNVARDFVELPSQIMEHWAIEPAILKQYAFHYSTGEAIPDNLIEKLQNASAFNTGFETVELVGAALLDMEYHMQSDYSNFEDQAFEDMVKAKIGMIPEIEFRYRGTFFNHIFNNDYSAGYYSYLWAEVLDADGYDEFVSTGILNPVTGMSFRKNILEMGGSEDPMTLYKRFRGHEPTADALLRNRGLK